MTKTYVALSNLRNQHVAFSNFKKSPCRSVDFRSLNFNHKYIHPSSVSTTWSVDSQSSHARLHAPWQNILIKTKIFLTHAPKNLVILLSNPLNNGYSAHEGCHQRLYTSLETVCMHILGYGYDIENSCR